MEFARKTVVITGGSRGLGLDMVRLLAKEGANLAMLARNEPELAAATRELVGLGATVLPIRCDVGDRKQVEAAFHRANFKGRSQQECAWFSALATNPLVAMIAARAAKQVFHALRFAVPDKTRQELKTGFESRTDKVPRRLVKLGDRAAQKNNELIAKYKNNP